MRVLEEVAISAMGKMVMSMTMGHVVGLKTLILRGSGFLSSKAAKVRHRRGLLGGGIFGGPLAFSQLHRGGSVAHHIKMTQELSTAHCSHNSSFFLLQIE